MATNMNILFLAAFIEGVFDAANRRHQQQYIRRSLFYSVASYSASAAKVIKELCRLVENRFGDFEINQSTFLDVWRAKYFCFKIR